MPIIQIVFLGDKDEKIVEVVANSIIISNVQDALDLMVNPSLQGTRKIILHQSSISPDFFELRTGLAGEILQKFVNYGVQLAIVGDFKNITSKSLNDFITECNRGTSFFFQDSVEDATKILCPE